MAHLINSPIYQPCVVIQKFHYELFVIIIAQCIMLDYHKTNQCFEEVWKVVEDL